MAGCCMACFVRSDPFRRVFANTRPSRWGRRLGAAVNNAGIDGKFGRISDQDDESYKAVFDANVLGMLLGMQHERRVMRQQGFESIVNLSSSMSVKGAPNASVYVGSKHAVEGIAKAIALEATPFGVRVNAVTPGPIRTEMLERIVGDDAGRAAMISVVPMKRAGTSEEIARMIVFVASDQVPFMTAEIVCVNGGKTAWRAQPKCTADWFVRSVAPPCLIIQPGQVTTSLTDGVAVSTHTDCWNHKMPTLFEPYTLRTVTFRNRIIELLPVWWTRSLS
jgi:NAD(P)-dependent dehydrogenase (short-subunit alcohol dehydrogenase family)